ncbi:hypothetical protein G9A89_011753 [Geosiphon pyriformis]|nr:hypothetical protein G9A89_011753 [Geosiphon pyriformis]
MVSLRWGMGDSNPRQSLRSWESPNSGSAIKTERSDRTQHSRFVYCNGHALDFKVGSLQFVRCPASPTALEYLQFFHKLIEDRSEPKDKNIKIL